MSDHAVKCRRTLVLLKGPHMANKSIALPDELVENAILVIRGHKVILDRDLARLYGVSTKAFNQAVKRNSDRFPEDFMFQLNDKETQAWQKTRVSRSQNVTLNATRGTNIKYRSFAFTEHGILMLSSVLRSERAVHANIQIMRTFVRLREMLASNATLLQRLDDLESEYDDRFRVVFKALRQLMNPTVAKTKPIGFRPKSLKK